VRLHLPPSLTPSRSAQLQVAAIPPPPSAIVLPGMVTSSSSAFSPTYSGSSSARSLYQDEFRIVAGPLPCPPRPSLVGCAPLGDQMIRSIHSLLYARKTPVGGFRIFVESASSLYAGAESSARFLRPTMTPCPCAKGCVSGHLDRLWTASSLVDLLALLPPQISGKIGRLSFISLAPVTRQIPVSPLVFRRASAEVFFPQPSVISSNRRASIPSAACRRHGLLPPPPNPFNIALLVSPEAGRLWGARSSSPLSGIHMSRLGRKTLRVG